MPEPIVSGGGGSAPGTVAGIPTKWLLIGGGAAVLGFFFLQQRGGGGGSAADPGDVKYGAALGPNAALALGDLQSRVMRESGLQQEQNKDYFDTLSERFQAQAAALSDQATVSQNWINRSEELARHNAAFIQRFEHENAQRRAEFEQLWALIHGGD